MMTVFKSSNICFISQLEIRNTFFGFGDNGLPLHSAGSWKSNGKLRLKQCTAFVEHFTGRCPTIFLERKYLIPNKKW